MSKDEKFLKFTRWLQANVGQEGEGLVNIEGQEIPNAVLISVNELAREIIYVQVSDDDLVVLIVETFSYIGNHEAKSIVMTTHAFELLQSAVQL